jgi:hypothetical protein
MSLKSIIHSDIKDYRDGIDLDKAVKFFKVFFITWRWQANNMKIIGHRQPGRSVL